jgi:cellulose synthase/poly-beta-1,6-N-acetylglucosamine synthase-like glycosyltransferase
MHLAAKFDDPDTGAVAGEKKLLRVSGMGRAEGWYWKYESFMKSLDAAFHSVISATGEVFALRTALYRELPENTVLDDLVLSMNIKFQGYRIAYEPRAFATETPSISLAEEKKRKVRIASGAFQVLKNISITALLKKPLFLFQFFSRRFLRWVVCPVCLFLLLPLNLVLCFSENSLFVLLLSAQLVFYALATVGWYLIRNNRSFAPATIPFYFLFMNACMISGWYRFRKCEQTVLWKQSRRMQETPG